MKTLVLGASGATGKMVVSQLLERNLSARIVVRETARLPISISENKNIEIVRGNIDEFSVGQIKKLMVDCDSIVCCLGHNLNFKGLFGRPRKLVVHAVEKITEAMASFDSSRKFILMSTTAYTNQQQGEQNISREKLIFSLLEIFLPPHKDNMLAGDHLVYHITNQIEWVAVRPDSLIDADQISAYEVFPSRIKSPISNPGQTSRINVGHFMVELLINPELWQRWKHKTPVIYNKE